ncbi:MAG: ATPase, partial [Actinobacteria bacterium]|nr:ATPase [Actinomycetota bacterium]
MPGSDHGTAKVTLPTDEQILITREFDAPKHLVY